MLYASGLYRQTGLAKYAVEENLDNIPDLVAEILSRRVEQRLRRNLSFGYLPREETISRVRGRIDVLRTERRSLIERGFIACKFEDLTVNTPRNRYIRAALDKAARIVRRPELAHRCRTLGANLFQLGVTSERPSRSEMSSDRLGRHDKDDDFMLEAAKLIFELMLPLEIIGNRSLATPDRDLLWIRHLYEKAIAGFYDVVLSPEGWRVDAGKFIGWQVERSSVGISNILPQMQTDIILNHAGINRRIIIDTKFNSILCVGRFRSETLRSGYIYQIYAYVRSQEDAESPKTMNSTGLLLHPAVDEMIDETVVIQGHPIRFATVDLATAPQDIRRQLLRVIEEPFLYASIPQQERQTEGGIRS